jgi:hypothetical protein
MAPTFAKMLRVVTKMKQRIERTIRYHPNIAATTTITARRTTAGHELLAPESGDAIAAVAALHMDLDAINKHLNRKPKLKATPALSLSTWLRRRVMRCLVCTLYAEDACSWG